MPIAQSEKTISELLADIGIRHEPAPGHYGLRRLIVANGRTLDLLDAHAACVLLCTAECAA